MTCAPPHLATPPQLLNLLRHIHFEADRRHQIFSDWDQKMIA